MSSINRRRRPRPVMTLDEFHAMLARNERFAEFMGWDVDVVDAMNCERAFSAIPGAEVTDMDVEDFTRTILKSRVDVQGQDPVVLIRWGI